MSKEPERSAGHEGLLRLIALDEDDLAVLSAHVQDAVLRVGDVTWLPKEGRFLVMMNRFAWEAEGKGSRRRREHQRRRSCLLFARVAAVQSIGIDRSAADDALELLAVRFEAGESPSGDVVLDFAGGAAIRLAAECLEAQLADLGPTWSTPHAPRHFGA
jgi:hypothetical protein